MNDLVVALDRASAGDFTVRLRPAAGVTPEVADAFNKLVEANARMASEVERVGKVVGRDGLITERASLPRDTGAWQQSVTSINSLIDDLVRPTTEFARVIDAVAQGDLSQRMALRIEGRQVKGEFLRIRSTVNAMVDRLSSFADEVTRVAREVGTEGKLGGQAKVKGVSGVWKDLTDNVNTLAGNLTSQVRNIAEVTTAVANGDLSRKVTVDVRGEVLQLKDTVNTMVDQLRSFADEVTRVAREVGTEGKLGGQAHVGGVSGVWKDLTDNVNTLAGNLTTQVRNIAQVTTAVAKGDLSQKITVDARGEVLQLKDTVNTMVDQLRSFADEVTRVAREVGTEGKLGGQANVEGVSGVWKDLTDNVNTLAGNLTNQVRNIAEVTTAVANGDLSQKITVDVRGEVLQLKDTINTMVDQLRSFAAEVTRVAREVGTEGRLGGQANVEGVSGTWRDLTDNVNTLAGNLTDQVRNIAQVATAVARGDLSQKITVDAKGEILALKSTINTMVDQLSSFADEVTRVAREVGTDGKLGGQANVRGVSGTWRDLTDSVNFMASNLTSQVRNIAEVTTAVATGDLSQKITVDVKGEILELKNTINTMVDQLRSFADEVTRVAREVGTEGKLGGQANVEGVSGVWKDLTDNVNTLAGNLTSQVRNIAEVTTAVATGDLSQKITVNVKGEILELKNTINTMVDQLSSFADEVTRVAREVGTEGKLGGQANVEGVSGVWKDLTDNVNFMASSLTTQVRAIADVSMAVTQGDLTQSITVETQGEVAELKDRINQMIVNLRETTARNAEQTWLSSNLARFSGSMQGQRDLGVVSNLIMSELTPLVGAHHGAFFLVDSNDGDEPVLALAASYGLTKRRGMRTRVRAGEGLVGQAVVEKKPILVTNAPPSYLRISSALGDAAPVNVIVLPVLFEDRVMGVIELASFSPFSDVQLAFFEQLAETVGIVINAIVANMRTEELLEQSQSLTQELQKQQRELQQTNDQLAEKNERIEVKNTELDMARLGIEEKAEQLALSSRYKSEFLANMSHELRTPLNSLLILAKLLSDNADGNLSDKQVEFARTIYAAGNDLLSLIDDILDLSKVEAGKMTVVPSDVSVAHVVDYVERSFRPLIEEKRLAFGISIDPDVPATLRTDEQRLQQILRNLLSNAVKFTERGGVYLDIVAAPAGGDEEAAIAFSVRDTGIGIAAERLALIFEPFQQADGTTSRRFGGTGLGLSISREIVKLLSGTIEVRSEVGAGSTFTLVVPRTLADPGISTGIEVDGQLAADTAARVDAALLDRTGIEDDRDDLTESAPLLLIVEDDPGFAQTLVHVGRDEGFKCVVALRGDTGVALAHQLQPSAILLDVGLPVIDGLTVVDRLKRHPATAAIPIHVLSGAEAPALLREACASFVEKPIDDATLRELLASIAASSPPRPGRVDAAEQVPGEISFAGRRALIVDDDVRNVFALASALEAHGMEIAYAENGAEAIRTLESDPIDIALMDVMMPEMDGYQTMRTIRSMPQLAGLPIIAVTAKAMRGDRERSIAAGASDYITKPVDTDVLLSLLDIWLYDPTRVAVSAGVEASAV